MGDVIEMNFVWCVDGVKVGYIGLFVKDGILYVVVDIGNMYVYDIENGELLWEYDLGMVGKGFFIFVDGKIYVMEVNGNVYILKLMCEGCEMFLYVEIFVSSGVGMDEIYVLLVIFDGKVILVICDCMICLFDELKKWEDGEEFFLLDEGFVDDEIVLF